MPPKVLFAEGRSPEANSTFGGTEAHSLTRNSKKGNVYLFYIFWSNILNLKSTKTKKIKMFCLFVQTPSKSPLSNCKKRGKSGLNKKKILKHQIKDQLKWRAYPEYCKAGKDLKYLIWNAYWWPPFIFTICFNTKEKTRWISKAVVILPVNSREVSHCERF